MLAALVLNSILFMGEIFQLLKGMTYLEYKWNLTALKNLVLAPVAEEFVYRTCLINIFIESGAFSPKTSVLITPCFFAIAHLHHVVQQQTNIAERTSWKRAMLIALFKLMYTEVFGIYAGMVYLRTGSLWAAIALHS